jgi:hypothetical protein
MADPDFRVVVDIQTARNGQVQVVGERGQIVEVPLSALDRTIYYTDLGWSAEMFKRSEDVIGEVEAVTGIQARMQANGPAYLELTTDAPDISPLNGVPEILADGRSTATIFIQKKTRLGEPLLGEEDNDLVHLRTTRGTLSHRQVRLVRGQAMFTLRSSTDTIVADVTAYGADLKHHMIHIEFAPPPALEP